MGRDGKLTTQLAVGLTALGFLLMFLGWNGAAGYDTPEQQFPWLLSATAPGLGLVLTGLTLALVQELRRLTARVLETLERREGATAEEGPYAAPVAAPAGDTGHVVATATTFHAPDCEVIAGRDDLTSLDPDTATTLDLAACRVCEPDADATSAA